jgi:hypothetical protein
MNVCNVFLLLLGRNIFPTFQKLFLTLYLHQLTQHNFPSNIVLMMILERIGGEEEDSGAGDDVLCLLFVSSSLPDTLFRYHSPHSNLITFREVQRENYIPNESLTFFLNNISFFLQFEVKKIHEPTIIK